MSKTKKTVEETVSEKVFVGVKPLHYRHTYNSSEEPLHIMTKDFGKSNTDISDWKPKVADIRAFLASPNTKSKQFLYDFPDGKDTGEAVQTFLRTPGLDITEVETAEKIITQIVQNKSELDKQTAEQKEQMQNLLDTIKSVKTSSESSSTDSSAQPASSQQ